MTIEQKSSETSFNYDTAFGINYGILSPEEQNRIRRSRVTILGMFVGGTIATLLARSGASKFVLIDNSRFQLSDTNRDIGCYLDTIGEFKAEIAKKQILRINPQASVDVVTEDVTLEGITKWLDWCDVFCAQSDDLAFSCHALMLAQQKKKFAVTFMPSGMTGYVEVFPPDLKKEVDPAVLFGSPSSLSYRQLYHFLRNPLNRCGRRWHITEGKWHIDWFCDWRDRKVIEPQLCPNIWMGASLASMEIIKFITGKWRQVKVPKMWHLLTTTNKVKIEGYRRRSWIFDKFIYWMFSIEWVGFGSHYRRFTTRRLLRELEGMKKQESEGRQVKPPFMWRHLI